MKRNYFSLFAAATMMMAVTSCSQEEDFAPVQSGDMTTFKVNLEGAAASRAAADGMTAKKLYFEVYQGTKPVIDNYAPGGETIGSYTAPVTLTDGKAEIKLPLLRGEMYKIMFWAQAADGSIYDPANLQEIQVNYKDANNVNQTKANIEAYDAFFFGDAEFQASTNVTEITLRRPFAQLNVGTTKTDWETAISMIDGTNLPVTTSEVTVTGLANQFNVLKGEATGSVDVTFQKNNLLFSAFDENGKPTDVEGFKATVNDVENEYRYLAMNYLLVPGTAASTSTDKVSGTTDVTATFWRGEQLLFSIEKTNLANVPIQRNWRTNILGNLLADDKTFTIQIDNDFENDENIEIEIFADGIIKDAEGNYHITKAEGLWALANLLNNSSRATFDYTFKNQTFVLDCDIDLQGAEWTPMDGFAGTFDGKGKTITNFNVNKAKSAGLFGTLGTSAVIKNLTVTEAAIVGHHYAGVIAGYGYATIDNCHVKNSTVTLTTELINGAHDNGDKAGAIIGYLCEEVAQNAQTGIDYVKNCSAENVTIRGYRDIGGLVGIANGTATVSNNTISNSIIVIDKANNYKNYTTDAEFHGGDVVGEKATNATVENNTATDVEITYINGENYSGYYQDAEGNFIATETKGISALIEQGETEINLADGSIAMPTEGLQGKTLTFTGSRNAELDLTPVAGNYQNVSGATLSFNGITVKYGTENYKGMQHANAVTYNDCAINGLQFLYAPTTFTNCDLNSNGAEHSVWTYGADEVSFTNCTFTYGDRAVNCYSDQGEQATNATFENCTFTKIESKSANEISGAIETNSSIMTSLNLNITNCTVNEGELWWVSKWDSKDGENTVVTLDGNRIIATNGQLKAAVAEGLTEINLTEGTFGIPSEIAGKTITFNGMGDGTVFDFTKAYNVGDATITFKNLYIEGVNANSMNGYGIQHTTKTIKYENCTLNNAITNENGGDVEYIGCTFTGTYYIATYAVKSAKFTNCIFDREDSRAVLVYSHGDNPCVVTLEGCTFKAKAKGYTGAGAWTAAVEIDTTNIPSEGTTVTITNCTADANYSGIVRDKSAAGKANAVIIVDGKECVADGLYKIADGQYELYKASGLSYKFTGAATVNVMNDIEGTVVMQSNLTINGNDYKIDAVNLHGADNLTLKNIKFDAAKAVMAYDGKGNERFYGNIISGGSSKNGKGTRGLVIEGCTFEGTFANGGTTIAFNDRNRGSGQSGNITIKNCTFNTQGGYVDIYTYYSGYGELNIEGNTFNSTVTDKPIYLGKYQSGTPVVVKGNEFKKVASFEDAAYIQDHSSYGVSFDAKDNTFATANE